MSTFLLNVPPPQTEILATPLQYRTGEEFMYEILFDVPPNQNPGAAPGGGVLMLIESYYNFTNQLCTWKPSDKK